eukprot:PhM_4_TR13865/c0_g1_i1/m.74787
MHSDLPWYQRCGPAVRVVFHNLPAAAQQSVAASAQLVDGKGSGFNGRITKADLMAAVNGSSSTINNNNTAPTPQRPAPAPTKPAVMPSSTATATATTLPPRPFLGAGFEGRNWKLSDSHLIRALVRRK